jgi:hypothetical protein
MKDRLQTLLLVLLAMGVGVLGTLLAQSAPADAQSQYGFRECFILAGDPGYSHVGNAQHLQNPVGRFPVPQGWQVVGSLGGTRNGLYLCR